MKTNTCILCLAAAIIGFSTIHAQNVQTQQNTEPTETRIEKSPDNSISHEVELKHSYVTSAQLRQGSAKVGDLESLDSNFKYVLSKSVSDGVLIRAGVDWERYDFGASFAGAPVPNTLQSTALILGADIEIAESWIMRAEIMPGIYSDFRDISIDDANIPAVVGFSYIVNKDLQWFFGLMANPRGQYPVIPGVGARWKFADQWTLMAVLPNPRLEYEYSDTLTFYGGLALQSGGFQVSKTFGSQNYGRTDLDNDHVEYTEVRVGPGVEWKFTPGFKLGAEAGAVVYRKLEYRQSDFTLHSSEPTPYCQIGITANF